MKTRNILLLFFIAFYACKNEPSPPSTSTTYNCEVTKAQLLQADTIVGIMQEVDAWGDDAALDSIADLNDTIASRLQALLTCAAVETLDLTSSDFENLYYAQTEDGRIRNFNWYANNGGTWQEMRRIYQYYPQPQVAKTTEVDYFAGATNFYTLKSESPMYLGFGADKTCSTCMVEYATLFSFDADTLKREEIITLESRMGDVLTFEFDPTTQTLSFAVIVDDLNEDWAKDMPKQKLSALDIDAEQAYEADENAEVVMGAFVFDGKGFKKQ